MHKQMILPNYVKRYCCTGQPLNTDGSFFPPLLDMKTNKTHEMSDQLKKKEKKKAHGFPGSTYTHTHKHTYTHI